MPSSYLTNATFGAIPTDAVISRPAAIVGRTSTQTIAKVDATQVGFSTTAVLDNGVATLGTAMVGPSTTHSGFSNTGTSNGSIYIRRSGVYQVSWRCAWNVASDNAGRRQSTVWKTTSGTDTIVMRDDQVPLNQNSDVHVAVSTIAALTNGDELWVSVYQSSTSNSSLLTTYGQPIELAVVYLGPSS